MRVSAVLRNARLSAQKARLVADLSAVSRLKGIERSCLYAEKGAQIIRSLLESAIANAEHNEGADIDALKVAVIYVDKGPA